MIQLVVLSLLCSVVALNGSPTDDKVMMARRLVHKSNFASVGSLFQGVLPMVNALSRRDVKVGVRSTGEIYLLMMDFLPEGEENKMDLVFDDTQEIGCVTGHSPIVMISGSLEKIKPGTGEYAQGWEAYKSRHAFANINRMFLCRLKIAKVLFFLNNQSNELPVESYYALQSENLD